MPSRLEVQQLLINNEFWELMNQQIYESFASRVNQVSGI